MRWVIVSALLVGCGGSAAPADAAVPDGAESVDGSCSADASLCLIVDDAGVSHGCNPGGMGPGDRDDGGGMSTVGPPDQGADLRDLPFGAECLFNAQCASSICFDYRVKGQFCTVPCGCNSDCPPASLGCGGQGVCRVGN